MYEASGTAGTGSYSNTATASGSYTDSAGHTRSDSASDGSSYYGADPQIAIDKVTVDGATSGDGLNILTGESIKWKYTVTNAGNVALSNVTVTDSVGGVTPVGVDANTDGYNDGDADKDGQLDLTEAWIFEASGTAVTGNYSNTGTASGSYTDDAGHTRTDTASDGISYFAAGPQIKIDRAVGLGHHRQEILHPRVGGSVWISGTRREVAELRQQGERVVLGPDDYGGLTAGSVAVFFQMVRPAGRIGRGLPGFLSDPGLVLAMLLSIFLHGAIAVLFVLAIIHAGPVPPDLELSDDLIRRFMVTPPPEDILEETAGETETEDVGIQDREEAGGQAAEGEEGRVGREDSEQEQTEMEGEVTGGGAAARVASMGVLGAIASRGSGTRPPDKRS